MDTNWSKWYGESQLFNDNVKRAPTLHMVEGHLNPFTMCVLLAWIDFALVVTVFLVMDALSALVLVTIDLASWCMAFLALLILDVAGLFASYALVASLTRA